MNRCLVCVIALWFCSPQLLFAAGTAPDGRHRPRDIVSLELEAYNWGHSTRFVAGGLQTVPASLLAVPVHRDDPQIAVNPLPAPGPMTYPMFFDQLSLLTAKLWLFETVAVGVGIRGRGNNSVGEFPFDESYDLASARYNYAVNYQNWGPAYTMYVISASLVSKPKGWIRVVYEARTPFCLRIPTPKGRLPVWCFASYEPNVLEVELTARNGWDRWGTQENWHFYDFGSVSYDRYAAGIAFFDEFKDVVTVHCFVAQDRVKVHPTDDGRACGLAARDGQLTFGIGFRINGWTFVRLYREENRSR